MRIATYVRHTFTLDGAERFRHTDNNSNDFTVDYLEVSVMQPTLRTAVFVRGKGISKTDGMPLAINRSTHMYVADLPQEIRDAVLATAVQQA
jgi:hypothetical protein